LAYHSLPNYNPYSGFSSPLKTYSSGFSVSHAPDIASFSHPHYRSVSPFIPFSPGFRNLPVFSFGTSSFRSQSSSPRPVPSIFLQMIVFVVLSEIVSSILFNPTECPMLLQSPEIVPIKSVINFFLSDTVVLLTLLLFNSVGCTS